MREPARGGRFVKRLLFASVLATLPPAVHALGLGNLVLRSALDQPLDAEIELISPSPKELRTLKSSLASRDDFGRAGIERPPHLLNIKYELVNRGSRHFIRLKTDEPFREPFLQMLLNVEWSGGKLVREYSTLIDPPQWAAATPPVLEAPAPTAAPAEPAVAATEPKPMEPASIEPKSAESIAVEPKPVEPVAVEPASPEPAAPPAPIAQAESPAPAPVEEAPVEAVAPPTEPVESLQPSGVAGEAAPAETEAATAEASDWASVGEYRVKRGDTLARIVRNVRADAGVSIEQAMVALFAANPNAFFQNNVNNLRAGRVLRVPAREAVELVSRPEARAQLASHYAAWREYRATLAAAENVIEAPEAAVEPAAPAVAEAPKAEPQAQPAKPAAPPVAAAPAKPQGAAEELLKIVRGDGEVAKAPGTSKAAGADGSKAKSPTVASDKVATLEEAVAARELENKALQERVGKAQEQIRNAQRLVELENKELAAAQKGAETPPASQPPVEAPAAAKPPRKKVVIPPPPPVESPGFLASFMESITSNPVTLAALGGIVVLGGGIGGLYALRRRKARTDFEESILSAGSATTDGVTGGEGSVPTATDTSFLSDFSQGGMGNIHTDEVDPIAEAEVYLAYGRDEQAEEILKDAVVKDGKRHELRQKLAEIYFQRNDARAFETVAEELYAALEGKGGKVWEKVEEMGRKIVPENPMFRAASTAPAAIEEAAQFSSPSASSAFASAGAGVGGEDFGSSAFGTATDAGESQFAMGADSAGQPGLSASPQETGGENIDFELNLGGGETAVASGAAGGGNANVSDSVDFDLGGAGDGFAANAAESGSNVLDFAPARSVAADASAPVAWDETATKLDLAKAYIDMGDAEGARSILDEVLAEGTDVQKKQAQDLARQIA
jgi:pilus assembly protein FimV